MFPEQIKALHVACLQTVRTGKLACLRCGGSGIYAHYGRCFRCGGGRFDPHQPKHPEKSKELARQQAWAAKYDENGDLIR